MHILKLIRLANQLRRWVARVRVPQVDLTKCKVTINQGKGGANSESMRRQAESLMKASLLWGRPS